MKGRLAVISTSYPRQPGDAAGHFVAAEVKRAVQAGHEVHVFAPGRGLGSGLVFLGEHGEHVHWLRDGGAFGWPGALARLREKPTRAFGATAFAVNAMRALKACGPFARVQAHFLVPSAWPIATLATASVSELELVGHGSDVRLFCALPGALRRHIARAWLKRGARVRVTSSELLALLSAANPELRDALRVEASPIDVQGVPSREEARSALNWAQGAPLAVVVGRLIAGKRVGSALTALALLEHVFIVVVGDGPELATLRARFPAVRFVGQVPRGEALRWIAAADVLVSASPEEGAPSVVREARALGVPVVAVDAGELAAWAAADAGIQLVPRSRL